MGEMEHFAWQFDTGSSSLAGDPYREDSVSGYSSLMGGPYKEEAAIGYHPLLGDPYREEAVNKVIGHPYEEEAVVRSAGDPYSEAIHRPLGDPYGEAALHCLGAHYGASALCAFGHPECQGAFCLSGDPYGQELILRGLGSTAAVDVQATELDLGDELPRTPQGALFPLVPSPGHLVAPAVSESSELATEPRHSRTRRLWRRRAWFSRVRHWSLGGHRSNLRRRSCAA